MRIIITGGHLSPAFSVIKKLDKKDILFIGRKKAMEGDNALSLEYRLCQKLRIPFVSIKTARLQRGFTKYTIPSLFNLPIGIVRALKIVREFKPDVVLGFGGYVSLPIIFASKFLNIPVVIHEQTLEAGFANKIASKIAKKVCISWKQSEKFFPKSKTVFTGNPIREELLLNRENSKNFFKFKNNNLPLIYITGGSLGSHAINIIVEKTLPSLLKVANVIHQTGDAQKYQDFERLSKKELEGYIVKKFFEVEEIAEIYKSASLVISRSGINTVTELLYFKKPSFLIPLPIGQRNEQLKNALFLKNLNLAEVCLQNRLSDDKFLRIISYMLKNTSKYQEKKGFEGLIRKNAALEIVKVLKNVKRS